MNHLRLYRQALVNKRIVGLSEIALTLEDGYWWALAETFSGDRTEVCGQFISSIRVIDGKLELAVGGHKLYLNWLDPNGRCVGPQFPEPGMIRCWRREEDPEWALIDEAFDTIDKALDGQQEE